MHECVYVCACMYVCVYDSIGQCMCDGCADAASVCMCMCVCLSVYTFIQSLTLVTKISYSSRGRVYMRWYMVYGVQGIVRCALSTSFTVG